MTTQPSSTRSTQAGSWTEALRDNPWPTLLVGAGLGYLLYRCCATSGRGWDAGYDERRTSARAFEADLPTM